MISTENVEGGQQKHNYVLLITYIEREIFEHLLQEI